MYVLHFSSPNLNIFFVLQVFEGKIKQKVECSRCSEASHSYHKFQELSLTIPPSNNDLTMQLCLDEHFAPDTGVTYKCKNCPKSGMALATIKNELVVAPKTIALKRFSQLCDAGDHKVNRASVKFDERLETKLGKYSLVAIITHFDTINSGHYISVVEVSENNWFKASDKKVSLISSISSEANLDTAGYLFFYNIEQKLQYYLKLQI